MVKFIKKTSKKAGLPPGTLVHIGDRKTDTVRMGLTDFSTEHLTETELKDIKEALPFCEAASTTWVNIEGVHDVSVIEAVGKQFKIHPLVLEDIVHTGQRPKIEDHEDYLFIVIKMIFQDREHDQTHSEQISFILGSRFLITFQEAPGDVFNPVRERLRRNKGRIRKSGCDYLAYALMDSVVDHYYSVLESAGDQIEVLEAALQETPGPDILQSIHRIKRDMIYLRKQIWPLRETLSGLIRSESCLVADSTGIFLADVYDHTVQAIDAVESFRDVLSGMLDLYLSTISNRMNEVMKVLTIMATIFIPLTFIAGIYGMNFKYMPELEWRWGYAGIWLVMGVVTVGMICFFKFKKWL